jgi:hypothetical protein
MRALSEIIPGLAPKLGQHGQIVYGSGGLAFRFCNGEQHGRTPGVQHGGDADGSPQMRKFSQIS